VASLAKVAFIAGSSTPAQFGTSRQAVLYASGRLPARILSRPGRRCLHSPHGDPEAAGAGTVCRASPARTELGAIALAAGRATRSWQVDERDAI
jgi:hypothetical protein